MREPETRKVRPWIAALLTFLGWGVGLYYARRTRLAVWFAAGPVLFGLAAVAAILIYLIVRGPTRLWTLWSPDGWTIADTAQITLTVLVAVFVWITAARRQKVQRAGPMRLLGYLAIWLGPLLAAVVLASCMRFFVAQPFRLPTASMAPTINLGEHFVVLKGAYGHTALSIAPLDGLAPAGRWRARLPERGDVVVFHPPHERRDYLKRIVGLPGDRMQMINGVLHINGTAVTREELGETTFTLGEGRATPARAVRETLPNGASYITLDLEPDALLDNTREVIVPSGHYYVLGDNRDYSDDSRRSIGFVPFENIIGRAIVRGE